MLGYLGEPASLGALIERPPHSLLRQSWDAKQQVEARVNADGWGAGIFLEDDPEPCVYVSTAPIWADPNRSSLGRALRARCLLAAVRSATEPRLATADTQPFAAEGLLFLHNGFIENFRTSLRRRLCGALSDERFASIAGSTDSEHLFALIRDELERVGGMGGPWRLLEATGAAMRRVEGWAREAGARAHLAAVVADGSTLLALRTSTEAEPPSLWCLLEPSSIAPGCLVASEPLDDDPRWTPIPPRHAVLVTRAEQRMVALP